MAEARKKIHGMQLLAVGRKWPELETNGEGNQHKETRRFQGNLIAGEKNQRNNGQEQDSEAVCVWRQWKVHNSSSFFKAILKNVSR
jgi:hypothetical protein